TPVDDPTALDEGAAAVELDPLDGGPPRVARFSPGREPDRLGVVDVAVAEDGVADPRVRGGDRGAPALREDVTASRDRPGPERVAEGARPAGQRRAVEREEVVGAGPARAVLDEVEGALGGRVRDCRLDREPFRDGNGGWRGGRVAFERRVIDRVEPG